MCRRPERGSRLGLRGLTLPIALVAAALAGGPLAWAQPAAAPSPSLLNPAPSMTVQEYQGWGCLTVGVVAGTGTFAYSDVITAAAAGIVDPVLLIPVVATGFAIGCSVGAAISPAFLWMFRRVF